MEDVLPVNEWLASLTLRPGYERLRVRSWTRDECLDWLYREGHFDCGMTYCDDEGLRSEVLIQKAESGR
jgi:hypothetical protein